MNLFGGFGGGCANNNCCGCDCFTLIILIWLLQCCGCGCNHCGDNSCMGGCDCCNIILILLLLSCCGGCGCR